MTSRPPGTQDFEWLDLGPPDRGDDDTARSVARPSRRTLVVRVASTVALVIAVALRSPVRRQLATAARAFGPPPVRATFGDDRTATADDGRSGPSDRRRQYPVSGQRRFTSIGHSLLGVTDGWDLFLRGRQRVVRVQMAAGRVTVTPTPALDGGTSRCSSPHDRAPSAVRFRERVQPCRTRRSRSSLAGSLAVGGNVYPGPVDGQFWQQITRQTSPRRSSWSTCSAAICTARSRCRRRSAARRCRTVPAT